MKKQINQQIPLFPRMKASPYFCFNCPLTYSSVCSKAMFRYPSRQARTPRCKDAQTKNRLTEKVTSIVHSGIQLHYHRTTDDLFQKIVWCMFATHLEQKKLRIMCWREKKLLPGKQSMLLLEFTISVLDVAEQKLRVITKTVQNRFLLKVNLFLSP